MRLYFNDTLISTGPGEDDIMAAFKGMMGRDKAHLELHRGHDEAMLVTLVPEKAAAQGGFIVTLMRRNEGFTIVLEHDRADDISKALREYGQGREPRLFEQEILDPDCPICAAMAGRSSNPARGNNPQAVKGPARMLAGIIQRMRGDRNRVSGHA